MLLASDFLTFLAEIVGSIFTIREQVVDIFMFLAQKFESKFSAVGISSSGSISFSSFCSSESLPESDPSESN